MINTLLLSGSFAALLGVASSQTYDATVCGKERVGEFNDTIMYYPNAWNPKSPENGHVCMSVDESGPSFDVVWNWPENIEDVHSYPYVRLNHENLPTKLSTIREMKLKTDWTMTLGNPSSPPRDFSTSTWDDNKEELLEAGVICNAAWDFFFDGDRMNTYNPVNSSYEVMIWLGKIGSGAQPLEGDSILTNMTVGDHEFSLWYNTNSGGRHVFTWVTRDGKDVNEFDGDVAPLLEYILSNPSDIEDFPSDPWLGLVEFGSETWFSNENVTFSAANFGMELDADGYDGARDDDNSGSSNNNNNGGSSNDNDSAGAAISLSTLTLVMPAAMALAVAFGF
ncbi:Endoglucanase cel12A like protein [Verticillium longisporum]|uniref:Endoglucanase cel12A like protein n=1 Tax=Verticillium longisporum TaxID=100787 RepID=A0A8I2ZIJ3_VERLO|nr:Endoglucanase cel12A like protein [Verticillium longisporum]RBQ86022.1 hypothetical protein VDGD_02125 [Verticillium dahliae]